MVNPIYSDGSGFSSTIQATTLNPGTLTVPSSLTQVDRFWSSQRASIDDASKEVLEIDFSTSSLVNNITFEAARYPQTISIEYTVDNGQDWIPIRDEITLLNIQPVILRSFPVILPLPNSIEGHQHPQHDFDGHWEKFSFRIAADTIQKLRFVIQRNPAGIAPVGPDGAAVPYSVAIQNIYIGYDIRSKQDVPRVLLEDDSTQTSQTFANSADILKSNLGFAKRTRYARPAMEDSNVVWKCEPQPFPNAVVNFYVDARDSKGRPQIIDRIFIDPLYEGPNVNLYYSNDSVPADFNSSRTALTQSQSFFNDSRIVNDKISLGDYGDLTNSPYVKINNDFLAFDPTKPWWFGIQWNSTYPQLIDGFNHPLVSCDSFEFGFNDEGYYLTVAGAGEIDLPYDITDFAPISTTPVENDGVMAFSTTSTLMVNPPGVNPGVVNIQNSNFLDIITDSTQLSFPINQVIVSFDGASLTISAKGPDGYETRTEPLPVALPSLLPDWVYLGTDDTNTNFSWAEISAFILAQETLTSEGFLDDPLAYSRVSRFPDDTLPGAKRALLRFDPTLTSLSAPTGMIGGPAFHYENLNWTPIFREYAMHRGYMELPATKAKFWNLEITNLRPEINEKFSPVTRQIKTFPPEIESEFFVQGQDRSSYDDLGTNITQQLTGINGYFDRPRYVGTGLADGDTSNIEVVIAKDHNVAQALKKTGTQWKYQNWHPLTSVPKFTKVGVHEYNIQEVTPTTDVSFYAGLRNIALGRTTRNINQDYPIIEESFLDDMGVNSDSLWFVDENGLSSGSTSFAQSTSTRIPTQRGLRGLQFATQQSDAQYIDIKGEFSDPSYQPINVTSWTSTGDGKILGLTAVNDATDVALLVSRQTGPGLWADIPLNWLGGINWNAGTWGAMEGDNVSGSTTTYSMLEASSNRVEYTGGIQSSAINSPIGGRVYAAAKVTSTETLTQPLWLQIFDADTGNVYSEQQSNVVKGEIQEWYCGYDTAGFNAQVGETWGYLTGSNSFPVFWDTFVRPSDQTTLNYMDKSAHYWTTPTTSLQIVSGAAKVTSAGQRSQIDTQTPWGTLTVALGTLITGALTPLMDIGGIIIMNDGTVRDTTFSANVTTLSPVTLTAGHTYTFTFQLNPGPSPDPTLQGYQIVINDTTASTTQTITTTRSFSTVRAIMGAVNQTFTQFKWTPGVSQIDIQNQQLAMPVPGSTAVTFDDTESFSWIQSPNKIWKYTGPGTAIFTTVGSGFTVPALTGASSRLHGLGLVAGLAATPAGSGGFFGATDDPTTGLDYAPTGTYYYKVTPVSILNGEGAAVTGVSATSTLNGVINLSWTALGTADSYNIYRGTASGAEVFLDSSVTNSYSDLGYENAGRIAVPFGVQVSARVDIHEWFGTLAFWPSVMPTTVPAANINIAYLDGVDLVLKGDGSIYNNATSTQLLAPIGGFNPTTASLRVKFSNAQMLSAAEKTALGITTEPQAIIIMQGGTVLGSIKGTNLWNTTNRGIGTSGTDNTGTTYGVNQGFAWYPDGSLLAANTALMTWGNFTQNDTVSYGILENQIPPSTQNLAVRLIQKIPTNDFWFVESVALFWNPITWEFSCDDGVSWWLAQDIRNNPAAAVLFPLYLQAYDNLRWRVTSYAPNSYVHNITIRPWYYGDAADSAIRPTQLPQGPNSVPTDAYTRIENDPRWQQWSKPIPRWWWEK